MNPIDILRAEICLELRPPSRQVYREFVGGVLVGIAAYQRMGIDTEDEEQPEKTQEPEEKETQEVHTHSLRACLHTVCLHTVSRRCLPR